MKINLEDKDPFDYLRIEQETQAMLEREPEEIDNEWDDHGFKNAQDYQDYREG